MTHSSVPQLGIRQESMPENTTIRRALTIALIVIFGLGHVGASSLLASTFSTSTGCLPTACCCCGDDGEGCGCGGTCCGQPSEGDDSDDVPSGEDDGEIGFVCFCGLEQGDPVIATASSLVLISQMLAFSARTTVATNDPATWSHPVVLNSDHIVEAKPTPGVFRL